MLFLRFARCAFKPEPLDFDESCFQAFVGRLFESRMCFVFFKPMPLYFYKVERVFYLRLTGGGGGASGVSKIHNPRLFSFKIHIPHAKSKSTHTKLENEEGKPENTTLKLDTFQCCHRNIFTVYFLSDFTQIKARSQVQHFLATAMQYVLNSKRFQAWPGLTDCSYIALKYVSKICGLNFEIVAVTRPCIRFFSFR